MSQIPGQNKIAEAVVEITADTQQLEQGVEKANAEVGKLGATGAKSGIDIANNMLPAAAAVAAVGAAALEAGKQIGEAVEKSVNNGNADDYLFTRQEKLAELRKKAKEYRDEATKTTLTGTLDDLLSNGTSEGILASDRAKAVKNYNDTINEIAKLEEQSGPSSPEALRKKEARLQKEIDQAELATLEGAERIERKRQQTIERIRKEYGTDNEQARKLEELINQAAERDKQKAEQNDLDAIEKRKNAYMDLIRQQERAAMESNERIAKHAAETMAKALAGVSADFNRQFTAQFNQLQFTVEGLAQSVAQIARQRRAVG